MVEVSSSLLYTSIIEEFLFARMTISAFTHCIFMSLLCYTEIYLNQFLEEFSTLEWLSLFLVLTAL